MNFTPDSTTQLSTELQYEAGTLITQNLAYMARTPRAEFSGLGRERIRPKTHHKKQLTPISGRALSRHLPKSRAETELSPALSFSLHIGLSLTRAGIGQSGHQDGGIRRREGWPIQVCVCARARVRARHRSFHSPLFKLFVKKY